jgi:Helix-turn-helix domain
MIPEPENRATQRGRILGLLIDARGAWVELPAILELQISQFGSRIFELRRSGFTIENEQEVVGGQRHSRYRLVLGAGVVEQHPSQRPLFPLCDQAGRGYRDDG